MTITVDRLIDVMKKARGRRSLRGAAMVAGMGYMRIWRSERGTSATIRDAAILLRYLQALGVDLGELSRDSVTARRHGGVKVLSRQVD